MIHRLLNHKAFIVVSLCIKSSYSKTKYMKSKQDIKRYPLSSPQREIWFDQMLQPETPLYNIGCYTHIKGPVDPALFESAVKLLTQSYDAFRTRLIYGNGEIPEQIFIEDLSAATPFYDFSQNDNPHESALAWMQEQLVKPFELIEKPLFRFALLKINENCFYFFFAYHHLIIDGWAIALTSKRLGRIYSALLKGANLNLNAPSYQYFIENDRAYIESARYKSDLLYWTEKYQTLPAPLLTPRYLNQFTGVTPPSERLDFRLPRHFYNRFLTFAVNNNSTLFHVMQGALYVYFTRTTNREDMAVGLPVRNRSNADFKETAGLFVGMNAAWFRFGTNLNFRQLLKEIGKSLRSDYRYQRLPIGELNRAAGVHKMGRRQIFDVQLNYANHDYDTNFGDSKAQTIVLTSNLEQAPLSISVWEFHENEEVQIDFDYKLSYFDASEVEHIKARFMHIMEYVLTHVDESISSIPLLTKIESQQLHDWSKTESIYSKEKTVVELFQTQVEKTPDNIALVFPSTGSGKDSDQQLTYKQLNQKANQLAHYLLNLQTGSDNRLIGICVERSLEMVVGLLGILKAGGAYLPLDSEYPDERLAFMINDAGIQILITQSDLQTKFDSIANDELSIVNIETALNSQPSIVNLQSPIFNPENLAYVIYTSGSTGTPKGAGVPHQAVARLVHQTNYACLDAGQTFLQYAPLSFDAATFEVWGALLNGAKLVVMPPDKRSLSQLSQSLLEQKVTILWLTSSLFNLMLDEQPEGLLNIKQLLVGGEELSVPHIQRALKELPNTQLINGYGPTENTTFTCCYPIERKDYPVSIPIGKPIANTSVYILDECMRPMPIGLAGELYTGGLGLAHGYHNRPELTAEKFIEIELFGKRQRLYKTGDLARWLPTGNIEYIGRLDHQVKLRGYRIELGEIEAALSRHEAVKEAVVELYKKDDNPRLVAYITLAGDQSSVINNQSSTDIDQTALIIELRAWLKNRLPEYMEPASFTVIDEFPLTPNGKIDRKALPKPDLTFQAEQQTLQTETERLLSNLWSQALGIEITSALTHFFEASGHSLLAVKLVSRIRERFNIEMPLRIIFEKPILTEQAEWLDKQQRCAEMPPIRPLGEGTPLALSFAQQRLWFLAELEGVSATYNMPIALRLQGKLNEPALQKASTSLIQRHDSLRLCFPTVNGEPIARLKGIYNPFKKVVDLTDLAETEQQCRVAELTADHAQAPFDLSAGSLLSLRLLKLSNEEHLLLFNMHHIISDGWSIGVMMREWSQLYNAYAMNNEPQLLKPLIQYTDYSAWQREWLQGDALEKQCAYWVRKLAGAPELLDLPTDNPRPAVTRYQGRLLQSALNHELAQGIKQLSRQQGSTVFMTLLAAFNVLLFRYSGQTDLVVGCPIANRAQRQTEDMIGFFVNTLALRSQIKDEQTFTELLKQVRTTALEAYSRQDIPFEYLVEQLNPSRSLSYAPLFQVMFALQNTPEEKPEFNGLKVSTLEPTQTTAKFDLTLSVVEHDNSFVCDWEYNTDLFREDTIIRMTKHFQRLLEGIINNPEQSLVKLPLLPEAELQQLQDLNQTQTDYAKDKTVVDLFQEQVEKTPDKVAVVFSSTGSEQDSNQRLSYNELNTRANQLAHYLRTLGVKAETLVGICAARSMEMVVGLLGILKAGGAYVPLDPEYPEERLAFMTKDSGIRILITQSELQTKLFSTVNCELSIVNIETELNNQSSIDNLHSSIVNPENLAYVIYTSGSTGTPKGAMIGHLGLTNVIQTQAQTFNINRESRFLQFASLSFDASTFEIFLSLTRGATLQLSAVNKLAPDDQFIKLINNQSVTHVLLPPSFLAALPQEKLTGIETIIVGGETCSAELASKWSNGRRFFNAYGPTESAICVTQTECRPNGKAPPIGKPLANTQIYILDANLNPAPFGLPGELCIAGVGLARGYLNRPELTADKFKEIEIFGKHKRIYKTGDLARWLPDGNLEYLGRIDHQVKLRGYRIELGEIETALCRHAAVKEAVVELYNKDDNPRLIAYVSLSRRIDDVAKELRDHLKASLPEYMLPAGFMALDELPLTRNNKIDRKALPKPDSILIQSDAVFIKPQTHVQQQIAEVWQELLKLDKVGIHDNFFDLGGHSLLLIKAQNRLQELLDKPLPAVKLFQYPTIQSLAAYLSRNEDEKSFTQTKPARGEPDDVAVIGMAGRFPGAHNIEIFWNNIREGLETIQFFSDDEILKNGVEPALLNNPDYVKAGGTLDGADLFDAAFFGYTPKEAEIIDPQQRLFLEIAWAGIEHAGYAPGAVNFPVGIFAGAGMNTYLINNLLPNKTLVKTHGDYQLMLGGVNDFIATRAAYKLNLKGPALTAQTACSTSLVATHVACQSLLNGECEMALAGGSSISFPQKQGYLHKEGMIASPDGHCRAFDASAQGTVRGSGVGVVVLKRLSRALKDGDTIHAVIKGSAINNDGMGKVGFTAPGVDGQEAAIAKAMQGLDYESISYIEAHGTGTSLGDPIEVAALTQAYRAQTQKNGYCALGSVKTNVGHLDTAAGVTGLIKTVMALKHREIPPSLHFKNPNPQIDFKNSPFFVNTDLKEWQSPEPLRAGVSSFGIGGTNAHVVLEEAPMQTSTKSRPWQLMCISAKTDTALKQLSRNVADHIAAHPELNPADTAYTLNIGRAAFTRRAFLVSQNLSDTADILRNHNPNDLRQSITDDSEPQIVFMFPGQGSQHVNMAAGLYKNEPQFRSIVDECAEMLKPHLGFDLRDTLYPSNDAKPHFESTEEILPALFVTEYALAKLCMAWGIEPTVMIGHETGEYVAACLAGVFSLSDALQLAATQGKLIKTQGQYKLSTEGLQTLVEQDNHIFLELGPGAELSGLVSQYKQDATTFNMLRPVDSDQDDQAFLLNTLGGLWLSNVKLNWPAFYANEQRLRIPLPTYPFESKRYWVEPAKLIPAETETESLVKRPLDEWFYLPDWKRTAPILLQPGAKPLNLSSWLIFKDNRGLGDELATELKKQGCRVIEALRGATFEQHNAQSYTMRPRKRDDYQCLFDALKNSGQQPDAILHLWSLDAANKLEQSQIMGFYSLLFLAQTWPKMIHKRHLFVVSNQIHEVTGDEEPQTMAATLLGPAQTIGSEYTDIHCRGIDIVMPGSGKERRQQIANLLKECQTCVPDNIVAYRNKQRWIRSFESIRLPATKPDAPTLRDKGVCLITGGLGGIGLALAKYLATRVKARLALISRSVLPESRAWDDWLASHAEDDMTSVKIRRIRELQTLGSEVLVLNADVGNREQMQDAIEQAKARFGAIHGVIHSAGEPAGCVIELKTETEAARILLPKVEGTIILNELLDAQQLDFMAFCSSLNSMMGTPGQVDYCGANAFQDAYAHALYKQNINAVSINWAGWLEVGMAANIKLPEIMRADYEQDLQANGILPHEGVEAFERILANPMPQVLVSTTDWEKRLQSENERLKANTVKLKNINKTSGNNRPDITVKYVEPRNLTEQQIGDIWQSLLGIEPIGVHDDFFELGGHSLLMTQLISILHETFSVKLSMQALFETATIAELAEQVDKIQIVRQQLGKPADQDSEEIEEIEL